MVNPALVLQVGAALDEGVYEGVHEGVGVELGVYEGVSVSVGNVGAAEVSVGQVVYEIMLTKIVKKETGSMDLFRRVDF